MDHLPYPHDAYYPRMDIPYVNLDTVQNFDGGDFPTFPERAGWCEGGREWFDCVPHVAAARAQSWLYFGLIKYIFGLKFSKDNFIVDDAGIQRISTRSLPLLLDSWSRPNVSLLRHLAKKSLFMLVLLLTFPFGLFFRTRLEQIIVNPSPKLRSKYRTAILETEKNVRKIEAAFPNEEKVNLICVSLSSLLWSLRNAAAKSDFTLLKRSSLELSTNRYLHRLLLERGMCPHNLNTSIGSFSVATLHYLSGLRRPSGIHAKCSEKLCTAHIVDSATYQTKHVEDDCHCDFIGPNTAEIRRLIDSGDIPLICASIRNDTVGITVDQAELDVPYVAISHVWSDGLGNEKAVSLPACQIRRICNLIEPLRQQASSKLTPRWYNRARTVPSGPRHDSENRMDSPQKSCLFWLDTLCLPKEKIQRDLGINQMNRIYAGAQHVVITCGDLYRVEANAEKEKILASLVSSSWMGRCWTFPEGRLARNLLVDVGQMLQETFEIYNQVAYYGARYELYLGEWTDDLQFKRELASALYRLRPLKDDAERGELLASFVHIWNEMCYRTTSRASDKITIFALLLDLSVSEVKSVESGQRIRAVLRTRSHLPASFLLDGSTEAQGGASDHSWIPQEINKTANDQHGLLQKLQDIGSGEPGFRVLVPLQRKLLVTTSHMATSPIRWLRINKPKWQGFKIKFYEHERLQPNENSVDILYLIYEPTENTTDLAGYNGQGCLFKVIKEDRSSINVTYCCAFEYGVEIDEGRYGLTQSNNGQQEIALVQPAIEVRLKCDWTQWPLLRYQRSTSARLMTTTHGPSHPYTVILFFWELLLGLVAVPMVVIVFPNAPMFSEDFWLTASPAEWSLWVLCILSIIGRIHIVFHKELPLINYKLKAKEYQKWVASFDRPSTGENHSFKQAIPTSYQYSWWVLGGLLGLGLILIIIGLLVDQPDLYDLTITGGYLLTAIISRTLVEFWWRYPHMPNVKDKISKYWLLESYGGFPNYRELLTPKIFSPKYVRQVLRKPGLFTHNRQNLDDIYEDPLYLPRDYHRYK